MSDSTPGDRGAAVEVGTLDGSLNGAGILKAIQGILPLPLADVMKTATEIAEAQGRGLWVVGGVVRDAILGRPSEDLDLMVEPHPGDLLPGDDPYLIALAEALGAEARIHDTFRTATLSLPEGHHVDLAQAREETYPHSGALPEVKPGRIAADLKRRDFTINAMALALVGEGAPVCVDLHGGLGDLKAGRLRVLHAESFVDDPTRLYRGARFAGRLQYAWEPATESLAREAFARGLPMALSPQRLGHELEMMAREPRFFQGLEALDALGGLGSLGPVALTEALQGALEGLRDDYPAELMLGTEAPSLSEVRRLGLLQTGKGRAWGGILEGWGILGAEARAWVSDLKGISSLVEALNNGAATSVVVPILRGITGVGRHLFWSARPGLRAEIGRACLHLHRRLPLSGRDLIQEGWTPGPSLGNLLRALESAYLDGAFDTRDGGIAYARRLENGEHE